MSADASELRLHFQTTADLAAAKQTTDTVKDQAESVKDLGKAAEAQAEAQVAATAKSAGAIAEERKETAALAKDAKQTETAIDHLGKETVQQADQAQAAMQEESGKLKLVARDADAATAAMARLQQQSKETQKSVAAPSITKPKTEKPEENAALKGLKEGFENLAYSAGMGQFLRLGMVAGGVATAIGGAAAAVHEFAGAQSEITSLDAALAQTGQLADETREKYQALADAMEGDTGIDDGAWIQAMARLTQFGSRAETIERDTEAVKNLAGIMGGDLQTSSMLISKALEGNFTWTRRLGISLDENASQAKKLDTVFKELAARGGGQLEARAQTLAGSFGQVKNGFGDLLKFTGKFIVEVFPVREIMQGVADATSFWADKIGSTIPKVDGLTNAQHAWTQSALESERAARQFEQSIAREEHAMELLAEAIAHAREEDAARRSQKDEAVDANMALDLSVVDQAEKLHKMGRTEAITRRAAIRGAAEAAKQANQNEQERASQQRDDDSVGQYRALVDGIGSKIRTERNRIAAGNTRDNIQGHINSVKAMREDAQKKLDQYNDSHAQASAAASGGESFFGQPTPDVEQAQQTIESADKTLRDLEAKLRSYAGLPLTEVSEQRLKSWEEQLKKVLPVASKAEQAAAESAESRRNRLLNVKNVRRTEQATTAVSTATDISEAQQQDVAAARSGQLPQAPRLDSRFMQLLASIRDNYQANASNLDAIIQVTDAALAKAKDQQAKIENLTSRVNKIP